MHMPYLSVVIVAHNSGSTIEDCLKSIYRPDKGCEIIVVDDFSSDATAAIATRYADRVVRLPERRGRAYARWRGIESSAGEVIVNIDSDVVIAHDCLDKISAYFSQHPEYDALTGMLSESHPHKNFFSQYKNLYMHYVFSHLPSEVAFLYGSIYALRRSTAVSIHEVNIADDTALGQRLVSCGKNILFARDIEVIHLKRYGFLSLSANDFRIPFDWAILFFIYKGWRRLGKSRMAFAHASRTQIFSIASAVIAVILITISAIKGGTALMLLSAFFIMLWSILNADFFIYLKRKRGAYFFTLAILWTLFDNMLMAVGIACGFAAAAIVALKRKMKGDRIKG